MISWKNLDTLNVYKKFLALKGRVNIVEAMAGENGAKRVAEYSVPMACGMKYNFAAKAVDDTLSRCSSGTRGRTTGLIAKYEELLGGAVINTGEKRLVLHQLFAADKLKGMSLRTASTRRDFLCLPARKPLTSPTRFMPAKLQTQPVKSSQLLYRSVSAEVTWAPAPSTWLWRTGQRPTIPSRWKPASSATSIPTTRQPS